MNQGPIIFLAAFVALASSWFGLVLRPAVQLGRMDQMDPTNTLDKVSYPAGRPGLAREGLDVYRANGCGYCHSQQVRQTGTVCDVMLTEAGTNREPVVQALMKLGAVADEREANGFLAKLPKKVRGGLRREEADADLKVLGDAGAKTDMLILPVGPDLSLNWGYRRSVAEDFLYDSPVIPGSRRIGPDLANVGLRQADPNWHFQHLYAPRSLVDKSLMPPYQYMFEKRRIERARSPDALPAEFSPEPGYEIVPKREAKALVAYLMSLRADAGLVEAPFKRVVAVAAPATNAVATNGVTGAAGATNAPAK